MIRKTVRRTKKGRFELRLTPPERELLSGLGPRMREVFSDTDDPALQRLFPVAYPNDVDRQTEYRLLVHDELMASHAAALQTLEETAAAEELNEEQLLAWMRALNQIRLVMGTRLGVSEEGDERPSSPDDPRAATFAIYDYLSELQHEIIEALAAATPDPQPDS